MSMDDVYGGLSFATERKCCPECGREFAGDEVHGVVFGAAGVVIHGRSLRMSFRIQQVFGVLLRRFGALVHKNHIFFQVWGDSDADTKIVDVYICKLRAWLRDNDAPFVIENRWGAGYLLRARDVGNCDPGRSTRPTTETEAHAH